MNVAHRSADLLVGITVQLFVEKVEQSSVPLQQRDHPQRILGPGWRRGEGRGRFGREFFRELFIGQRTPKTAQCKSPIHRVDVSLSCRGSTARNFPLALSGRGKWEGNSTDTLTRHRFAMSASPGGRGE